MLAVAAASLVFMIATRSAPFTAVLLAEVAEAPRAVKSAATRVRVLAWRRR